MTRRIRADAAASEPAPMPPNVLPGAPKLARRSGWTWLLVSTFARITLAMMAGLLMWSLLPILLGWQSSVVMTGSMAPGIRPGDVAIVRPLDTELLHPGQVLLVRDPDHPDRMRLHRLVNIRPDGRLTLRGDANRVNDSSPVSLDAVRGVAVLSVPRIGMPAVWLSERRYGSVATLAAALVGLMLLTRGYRPSDVDDPVRRRPRNPSAGQGRRHHRARLARMRRRRRVAGLLVPMMIGVLVVGASSAAYAATTKYKGTTADTPNSFAANAYWTCAGAQANTPSYLYYPMGESSGTTVSDVSGNNQTGTYNGTFTYGATGSCAHDKTTAVTFNGTNSFISTPNTVASPSVFTIEAWFKTTTTSGGVVIGFGDSQTASGAVRDRVIYLNNTGQLYFGVYLSAAKVVHTTKSYNDGAWHLVDGTLSSAGLKLYLDGQLSASDPTITTAQSNTGYWRIGWQAITGSWTSAPTSQYLAATMDRCAVYDSALTAAQIATNYGSA